MMTFPFLVILMVLFALLLRLGSFYLGWGRLKTVLSVYALALAVSYAVLFILPADRLDSRAKLSPDEMIRVMELGHQAYEAAAEGRLDELPGVLSLRKWEFEFSGETLTLVTTGEQALHLVVVAERKEKADGIVEVTCRATPTLVNRIDVTGDIKLPEVELENQFLLLTMPGEYRVEIGEFNREFILAPLLGGSDEEGFFHTVIGTQILHLKVPANVRVEPGKAEVQFIDRTGE